MVTEGDVIRNDDKGHKVWFIVFVVFSILGMCLLVAIIVVWFLGHNNTPVTEMAEDICHKMEQVYVGGNSQDSLRELVEEFDEAVRSGNRSNDYDLGTCYIITRDFYVRNADEEKVLYYEGILDEILVDDDRTMEEIMEMEWEED